MGAESELCTLSKKIVSLSGPVTMLIEKLNLIEDSKLLAVSSFHPLENDKVKKVYGGVNVSRDSLKLLKKSEVVIFDESDELERFMQNNSLKSKEFKSRGKGPYEAMINSFEILEPYLTKSCFNKFLKLKATYDKSLDKLFKLKFARKLVFFIGPISEKKYPPIVIVKDGFVLTFIDKMNLETYPAPLAYIPHSQKVLNTLENALFVGVDDENQSVGLKVKKVTPSKWNLRFTGALIPGASQLDFLIKLSLYLKQQGILVAK